MFHVININISFSLLKDNPDFDGETGILGEVIDRLSEAEPPVVFWTGYKEISLISCVFLKDWTVMINSSSEEGEGEERRVERIFPRRWLDIRGRKMGEVWEGAVRAVMGVVVLHPGISQVCRMNLGFSLRHGR